MRCTDLRHLGGPNVFTASPVSIARLELDELTGRETTDYPGLAQRLIRLLPGLAGHHCAAGRPGGFLAALDRGTYFGHVAEHVALELSCLAGREVCLGRTLWAGADGHYDVVLECPPDEAATSPVPARLLGAAIEITEDLVAGRARTWTRDWPRSRFCGNRVSSGSVPPPSPRPPGAGAYRSAGSGPRACSGWVTAATGGWPAPRSPS